MLPWVVAGRWPSSSLQRALLSESTTEIGGAEAVEGADRYRFYVQLRPTECALVSIADANKANRTGSKYKDSGTHCSRTFNATCYVSAAVP